MLDDRLTEYDHAEGTSALSGQEARQRLERRLGRSLGDVRIHDGAQAEKLAKGLGARAFTIGRHIYLGERSAHEEVGEQEALLAHELWHVAEQTGLASNSMPLLNPPAPNRDASAPTSQQVAMADEERKFVTGLLSSPAPSPSEASAEAVEAFVLQEHRGEHGAEPEHDPEEIADRVYRLLMQDLLLERERGANIL